MDELFSKLILSNRLSLSLSLAIQQRAEASFERVVLTVVVFASESVVWCSIWNVCLRFEMVTVSNCSNPHPVCCGLWGLESLDLQVEGVIPFPINSKPFFSLSLFFSLLSACITINAAQYPKMTVMAGFVHDGHYPLVSRTWSHPLTQVWTRFAV